MPQDSSLDWASFPVVWLTSDRYQEQHKKELFVIHFASELFIYDLRILCVYCMYARAWCFSRSSANKK